MQQTVTPPGVSFVVRLWLEARSSLDEPVWRFQARHVQSGEQIYCRSLADLMAFVEQRAGVAPPLSAEGAESAAKGE